MKRLIFILFSFPLFANSQITPEISLETSGKKIMIGEQIEVALKLKVNAADSVTWPIIRDTLRKEVEVVSLNKIDTSYDEADVSIKYFKQTLKVTAFDSGYFAVKPFKFFVNGELLESRPFLVEAHTVNVNPQEEIKDIKSPFQAEMTFMDYVSLYWKTTLLIVVIIGVAAFLVWYLSKRKVTSAVQKIIQKPVIPPHVIALEKLEKLEQEKAWLKDDVKTYCSALSETLREYIEKQFNTIALEQTSQEIMLSISPLGEIDKSQKDNLKQFLETTDLVKFAKHKTLPEENKQLFEMAKKFVLTTVPKPKDTAESEEETHDTDVKPKTVTHA